MNLKIESSVFESYCVWLKNHIQALLQFPGFIKSACFLEPFSEDNFEKIVVHYYLESMEDLQYYFDHYAEKMRQSAHDRFPGKFIATRRILQSKTL